MVLKKELICSFLIIAVLMLCVPSVTASGSKLTTDTHNEYATDVRSQQARAAPLSSQLVIMITNQYGHSINTTTVNHPVFIYGNLFQNAVIAPVRIRCAYVDIQVQNPCNGKWTTMFTATTDDSGSFFVKRVPAATGVCNIRGYYDGNGQYSPCVSKVVQLTVVPSAQ